MGFMDELRKLTQPYEDEDDYYEGADSSPQQSAPTEAQLEFENAFGGTEVPELSSLRGERVFFPPSAAGVLQNSNRLRERKRLNSPARNSRLFFLIRRALMKPATLFSILFRGAVLL